VLLKTGIEKLNMVAVAGYLEGRTGLGAENFVGAGGHCVCTFGEFSLRKCRFTFTSFSIWMCIENYFFETYRVLRVVMIMLILTVGLFTFKSHR
jgi:hypothetical protein